MIFTSESNFFTGNTQKLIFKGNFYINNGNGFNKKPFSGIVANDFTIVKQMNDIDRDGYLDLIWYRPANPITNYTAVYFRLWNPATEDFRAEVTSIYDGLDQYSSLSIADVTADGWTDLILSQGFSNNSKTTFKVLTPLNFSKAQGKLVKIESGFGNATGISYGTLTAANPHYTTVAGLNTTSQNIQTCYVPHDPQRPLMGPGLMPQVCTTNAVNKLDIASFYSMIFNPYGNLTGEDANPGIDLTKPVLELVGPMYVVNTVSSSAPAANETIPGNVVADSTSVVSYDYHHMRAQAGGRGFLGFEKLTTTDIQSGVQTETIYRQDWPY
ncbi:MAG: hypothetical protein EOP48_34040, partial [Sphingobacteriales bacterium]